MDLNTKERYAQVQKSTLNILGHIKSGNSEKLQFSN